MDIFWNITINGWRLLKCQNLLPIYLENKLTVLWMIFAWFGSIHFNFVNCFVENLSSGCTLNLSPQPWLEIGASSDCHDFVTLFSGPNFPCLNWLTTAHLGTVQVQVGVLWGRKTLVERLRRNRQNKTYGPLRGEFNKINYQIIVLKEKVIEMINF